ncbi:MAG: leucyl aminopeptidase [Chloroflexi bacterium]|nr:leucyl aminopeptidase [Chloroflexota bacterium]
MHLTFESGDPTQAPTDALVVLVGTGSESPVWSVPAEDVDTSLSGGLKTLALDARFSGKTGTTLVVPTLGQAVSRRVVLAGVGPVAPLPATAVTRAAGAAARAARDAGARHVAFALPDPDWGIDSASALGAAAIGVSLGLYQFTAYRGAAAPASADGREVETIRFVSPGLDDASAARSLRRAGAVSRAVNFARDLGNEPASILTPEEFAARARSTAESFGLEIEVLGPPELAEIGAAATLAVGGGSVNGPRLIRLRYQPDTNTGDSRVPGLVGKAITFDTGGYSIKPYEGMLDMKGDMSGGAAVLGAMSALRDLECQTPVVATICAAENMISGTAFRPGDVLRGMNGVTMEILSTDAEGRLVLADGLVDTARRGATELIDLATLTGAAVVALGDGTTALFASEDRLADRLLSSAEEVGERMWRMPLIDELEQKIEGDVADIKNTGGRAGGAITAALFLKHFTERLPWAHLDIAGSARQQKASAIGPKGSTGVGVRTLLTYLTA